MATSSRKDTRVKCIFSNKETMFIPKETIGKIPYLQAYFRPVIDEKDWDISISRPVKTEHGEYILPVELQDADYTKPILSYVERGYALDLLTKLSTRCDVNRLVGLFDFLMIDKPKVMDLDTLRFLLKDDVKDYNVKIARRKHHHHSGRYGRMNARRAAGEFCIGLRMNCYDLSVPKNLQKSFDRMRFILSHPRIFRRRLRYHAMAISMKVLEPSLSKKQKCILDGWFKRYSTPPEYDNKESDDDREFSDG